MLRWMQHFRVQMLPEDRENQGPFTADLPVVMAELDSTFLSVRDTMVELKQRMVPGQISEGSFGTLEIVLAEALNNVVEHAYADHRGLITVHIQPRPEEICVSVRDQGHPMPAERLPEGRMRSYSEDVSELPEGGFGWFLIHSLTKDVSYQRAGESNILKFTMDLTAAD